MEEKRRDAVEEAVTTTDFLEKLHEIAMDTPLTWNLIKQQEYS